MGNKAKVLALIAILVCAAGCGSSRISVLETDVQQLKTEVGELSEKIEQAEDLKADIQQLREAYVTMLRQYRNAQQKVLDSIDASLRQLEQ